MCYDWWGFAGEMASYRSWMVMGIQQAGQRFQSLGGGYTARADSAQRRSSRMKEPLGSLEDDDEWVWI